MNADVSTAALSRGPAVAAIISAARAAITSLFSHRREHFYYFALVTTGEGHAPFLSAWSEEALEEASRGHSNPAEARRALRWSYADSPYCGYGMESFAPVVSLFAQRPPMDPFSPSTWQAEWLFRVGVMEEAMATLDTEGLFGSGSARGQVVINVEVTPPDATNTERAIRLNPPESLAGWLSEASEA